MVNYQNSKLYGIYHNTELLYIGSTSVILSQRFAQHKADCKNGKSMPLYNYIQEREQKWEGIYIELIEDHPCDNKEQLLKREGELIRDKKPLYNKRIEGRTKKEYYNDNRDAIRKYQNEYFNEPERKMKENERKKKYREDNQTELSAKQKELREIDGEKIRQYYRDYYRKNIEKYKAYRKQ